MTKEKDKSDREREKGKQTEPRFYVFIKVRSYECVFSALTLPFLGKFPYRNVKTHKHLNSLTKFC